MNVNVTMNCFKSIFVLFHTGERMGSVSDDCSTPPPPLPSSQPPPPPPPPPPFPSSPIFQHFDAPNLIIQKRSVSKIQLDEGCPSQDRGKPIVTLEDLQKVKLRQVSYAK